jgi:hypothetical protein
MYSIFPIYFIQNIIIIYTLFKEISIQRIITVNYTIDYIELRI